MADFYSGWVTPPNGGARYRIWLNVELVSQSIVNNQSTLSWALRIEKDRSWNGFYAYPGASWGVNLDGGSEELDGSGTQPSSAWNGTSTWLLGSGTTVVTHAADGSKVNMPVAADFTRSASGWAPSTMSLSSSMTLPTIPRATTPTLSDSTPDTAEAVTVTLTPASAGFSHRLHWAFAPGTGGTALDNKIAGLAGGGGSASGSVEGDSADGTPGNYWGVPAGTTTPTLTIPHAVFAQSVDFATRTVTLTVETYNGGTLIGTKTVTLQVTLAASQKPTIAGISNSEATVSPDVAALVGAYVQNVTRLALALTSPAGIHGSTIVSRSISVAGQTLTADGTTPNAISASGTVAITATVTDSRGRVSDVATQNVTVLAWAAPQFATTAAVVRALSSGVTDEDDGTYFKIDPADFSVSSLLVSAVQKNKVEYRLSYRLVGAGSYTVDGAGWIDPPDTPSVIRFTGALLSTFGSAALASAYEVLIEIRDVLATSSVVRTVPKAQVLMHLKGSDGVAFGGRHSGAANPVEILGRGKQASDGVTLRDLVDRGDLATTSAAGLTEYATNAEAIAGSATDLSMTPAAAKAALNDASNGYRLREVLEYTASGSFVKANYPWARAIRVRVIGGGGGGGGSAAASGGNQSFGQGGGGGGGAESFITDIAGLAASTTVTVGAGGSGVSGSGGGTGGTSSFGSLVVATGGAGGSVKPNNNYTAYVPGGDGGTGTAGDIQLNGGGGGSGTGDTASLCAGGAGGSSPMGGGGGANGTGAGAGGTTGKAGGKYGGGGGGASTNGGGSARAGGAGGAGIVIVEVYA
jgi:hypothetical protein